MITVTVKPTRRLFTRRLQWVFDIAASNGEPLHPNDTYNNRPECIHAPEVLFGDEPVELVVLDSTGAVESRRMLR